MMLTKEKCEEALSSIEFTLHQRVKPKKLGHCEDDNLDVLWELINEHFKDKKSLKERFDGFKGEKPKDNPWGDRYAYECSKEEINKWILEGYGMPPIREKDDVD